MAREHGGDWRKFEEQYGRQPLDFSASVSPLGMPEAAKKAVIDSLSRVSRYPDPDCVCLREKIGQAYHLDMEEILCGNGAGDLIDRLVRACKPRHALLPVPVFEEYRSALEAEGCLVTEYPLRSSEGFCLDEGILPMLTEDLDLVVLCEPNNPTGLLTSRSLKEKILSVCRKKRILLAIDECFMDFVDDSEKESMLPETPEGSLIILRAFTKFYGMAGLRLGWCACGDRGLLTRMKEAGQPWAVSTPAQEAGIAALSDTEYPQRVRSLIRSEREKLKKGLEECGCRVIPGRANFLLFYDETPDLEHRLGCRGIAIRSCGSFSGFAQGWYRAAVRTAADNESLIEAVREVHRWQEGS